MKRLKKLFAKKSAGILNIYCTAGFPQLNDTVSIMETIQESGADIIELGIPYSDPLADGETIQQSSQIALRNGMSIPFLLEQLKRFRSTVSIPVLLMGYLNPIEQYGFEKFCLEANRIGIDGLIIPDMPLIEFERAYSSILKKYGLDFIFLITPTTPDARIHLLDAASSGFLYAVSSGATTGSVIDYGAVSGYLKHLQKMQLQNPVLVGFGITDTAGYREVCKYAAGGIIGSAFIKVISKTGDVKELASEFIKSVLDNGDPI